MSASSIKPMATSALGALDAADRTVTQAIAILHAIEVAEFDHKNGQRLDAGSLAGAGMDVLQTGSAALDDARRALEHLADECDKPAVDMSLSALQADSIKNALHALLQVIPEDQPDVAGSVKVVIRLANDLAMHLITGGRHKLLKDSLESGGQS